MAGSGRRPRTGGRSGSALASLKAVFSLQAPPLLSPGVLPYSEQGKVLGDVCSEAGCRHLSVLTPIALLLRRAPGRVAAPWLA